MTETKITSLSEGNHDVQITLVGYDILNAVINVTADNVLCIGLGINGTLPGCGSSVGPGVVVSGWTVTVHMKESTATSSYTDWLVSKGGLTNVTLSDIFELKDAFIGLTNIGFTPTLPQIMECKDAFIGL